jgi:hypothetical protein
VSTGLRSFAWGLASDAGASLVSWATASRESGVAEELEAALEVVCSEAVAGLKNPCKFPVKASTEMAVIMATPIASRRKGNDSRRFASAPITCVVSPLSAARRWEGILSGSFGSLADAGDCKRRSGSSSKTRVPSHPQIYKVEICNDPQV